MLDGIVTAKATGARMQRALLLAVAACAHASPRAPEGYGLSRAHAIEVCLPPGEQALLKALRCPGGEPVEARRMGSVGARSAMADESDPRMLQQMDPGRPLAPGEPDLHIVDAIEVRCPGKTTTLFVDMYHCPPPPLVAPAGFTLEP
jgi:hypothetical protein